ncbi:uncharacterized protein LOC143372541 [Andrena cerasifolii]|uniref:uncharacterized protein LOC143372541 n=1 Tax=Andrena cerasifolii TaxID=2819439 RepID=UPI00403772B5
MEEDNRKADSRPYNVTPEKMHRPPQECGFSRRDAKTHSEEVKRKLHYTPQNSPDKYQKTPQSSGSYRKEAKSMSESNKRKGPPSHGESLEKISKVCPSGKFVNTLIGQWSKYTGLPTPLSQPSGVQENSMVEEMRRVYATEERKIQLLQKKLQAAEETISSLSASRETELRAKEEILRQLNTDWESITKYYYEISESLKGFQQHKDNLSALYNNVILRQRSAMKKVQEELSNMKLKDEEQRSIVAAAENKVINQEKRIQEIMIMEAELKKQLENIRSSAVSEKDRLNNAHAEERVELIKKQEKLTSVNEELLLQLKSVAEEKLNLEKLFEQKDKEIANLEEEISMRKNKNEELLCENAELGAKYEKLVDIKGELSKQLESKVQEVDRLRDNLDTRQEIESSLAQDLDMIEIKYRTIQTEFLNVENKLKETQTRNVELEKSIKDIKYNKEKSLAELNKRIQILTKEKETILLEKQAKIQEVENLQKSFQEKHELEVSALKKDFDTKLSEMKKTIVTQNSAFTKLNETINKMTEENEDRLVNQYSAKGDQDNLKEKSQLFIEPKFTEAIRAYETGSQQRLSQIRERRGQESTSKATPKSTPKDKEEMSNQETLDIYDFKKSETNHKLPKMLLEVRPEKRITIDLRSSPKVHDYAENSSPDKDKEVAKSVGSTPKQEQKKENSNDIPQKRKIFKTRGAMVRQYGTPQKMFKK